MPPSRLEAAIAQVHERIRMACNRVGRDPKSVTLVAVTKTLSRERVEEAIRSGLAVLGENRVQEAQRKIAAIKLPAEWHLIGHLQSNKARLAVPLFRRIHSIDGSRLAEKINEAAAEFDPLGHSPLQVLVQVNVSGEESKSGVAPGDLIPLVETIARLRHISVGGLMTIPPICEGLESTRPFFRNLRQLAEEVAERRIPGVKMNDLSMGMSEDFEVAIEEGATIVRIGRALFGERG